MRLADLAGLIAEQGLEGSPGTQIRPDDGEVRVTGATLDSRLVRPGDLYVALPGRAHHGAEFGAAAVDAGAVAVLTDRAGAELLVAPKGPVLVVEDVRRAMAPVAAVVYGRPADTLTTFGITGTNGKTTTSYLLDAALRAAGRHVGVIGTIGFLLDGTMLDAARTTVTTPESPELQGLLATMVESGMDSVVMEVSSHALVLGRVDAIRFDVTAFTNFGRDHLDFHGDLESYFEAKALLFTPERSAVAVLNVDDPRGRVLADRLQRSGGRVVTVSLIQESASYLVTRVALGPSGLTEVDVRTPTRKLSFELSLPGDFNVRNAVTALAMVDVCGLDLDRAVTGLAAATVPGRMQRVELGGGAPSVFVDFAHTPQAVEAALAAVAGPRRVVVLGCGGDRDPEKRGPIGAAAVRGAELVVVTDDNPRSEDPTAIRRQVLAGARAAQQVDDRGTEVMDGGDRRSAIRTGLERSRPGDVLVVLGKGHESGQQIGGQVLPFDDVEVVRSEWAALLSAGARP